MLFKHTVNAILPISKESNAFKGFKSTQIVNIVAKNIFKDLFQF